MTGTTFAQLVPIVVSPFLTRLYSPQHFGVFAVYMAIGSMMGIVATGRYELAVMLPKNDEDSATVAVVALLSAVLVSLVLFLAILLVNESVAQLLGSPEMAYWLYFVPLLSLATGVYQTLGYWVNRRKNYRRLAFSDIALKVTSEGTKWGLGIGALQALVGNGLIVGTMIGQVFAAGFLGWQVWREDRTQFRRVEMKGLWPQVRTYRKFPVYNVPYSVIVTFSNEFIVFALTAFHYLQVAGFLGLTRRVVIGPITFLSSSLGRVFFQEISVSLGTPRLEQLTMRLMLTIAEVFTLPFVFLAFWAPDIFQYVFGYEWREAGQYASVLVPAAFCLLFTSWPERIYEVAQKQHVSFFIQLGFDSMRVALIWTFLYIGVRPFFCVVAYSLIACVYNGVYLLGIFKIAQFRLKGLSLLCKKVVMLAGPFSGFLYFLHLSIPSVVYRFVLGGAVLALYLGSVAFFQMRRPVSS